MKRVYIQFNQLCDIHINNKKNNISTNITDNDKIMLKTYFKNANSSCTSGSHAELFSKRTNYNVRKITEGLYNVKEYLISNRQDTSSPKQEYFLQV
jgi:hypothetical protein